jgi:hypothetical protein
MQSFLEFVGLSIGLLFLAKFSVFLGMDVVHQQFSF